MAQQFRREFEDKIELYFDGDHKEFYDWAVMHENVIQEQTGLKISEWRHRSPDFIFAPCFVAYSALCRNFGFDNLFSKK